MEKQANIKFINNHIEQQKDILKPVSSKNIRNEITKFNLKIHEQKEKHNKDYLNAQGNFKASHNFLLVNSKEGHSDKSYKTSRLPGLDEPIKETGFAVEKGDKKKHFNEKSQFSDASRTNQPSKIYSINKIMESRRKDNSNYSTYNNDQPDKNVQVQTSLDLNNASNITDKKTYQEVNSDYEYMSQKDAQEHQIKQNMYYDKHKKRLNFLNQVRTSDQQPRLNSSFSAENHQPLGNPAISQSPEKSIFKLLTDRQDM